MGAFGYAALNVFAALLVTGVATAAEFARRTPAGRCPGRRCRSALTGGAGRRPRRDTRGVGLGSNTCSG